MSQWVASENSARVFRLRVSDWHLNVDHMSAIT